MTPEELAEYLASHRPAKKQAARQSALPTSLADPIRELTGSWDLIYPVHVIDDHVIGDGNDWVKLGAGFPHGLRANGWVYLKVGDRVLARCMAKRVEYRENLRYHTMGPNDTHDLIGGAAVLALDSSTWDSVDFAADDRHMQGYRYASTDDELGRVTHLVDGEPTDVHDLKRSTD